MMNLVATMGASTLSNNLSALEMLESGGAWEIYSQDGPSDETMLVNHDLGVGILKDDLFGLKVWDAPLRCLEQCGWYKVGDVDLSKPKE